MRAAIVAVLSLALLPLACDGCGDAPTPSETRCTLDGAELEVGESGRAADGCNTCLCTPALALACTERACDDAGPGGDGPDGGPDDAVDGGPDDAGPVDEGPCPDADDDGFFACVDPDHPERPAAVDCDDDRFHVQPGGIEFADTPEDDNCDGDNGDYQTCPCVTTDALAAADVAAAMDLCGARVTTAARAGADRQFAVLEAYEEIIGPRLRVRQDPGGPATIIGNGCVATLSSGEASGEVGADELIGSIAIDAEEPCGNDDPDPGLADGADICDLAKLTLRLAAPQNARGFAFDFMFLSYEWPEFLCLEFNDTFYAVVETEAVDGAAATNAAFDRNSRPITVNVGFFENPASWTVALDGSSFGESAVGGCPLPEEGCQQPSYCHDENLDVRNGSGSGWLTTTVPVAPGETDIELVLSIHDEADRDYDSLVVIDGFRWLPGPTELSTQKGDD